MGRMSRLAGHMRREWVNLILAAVLVALGVSAVVHGPKNLLALRQRAAQLQARREKLAAENIRLGTNVQKLRSDDRYLERAVRHELGYARSDELIYKFPDAPRDRR